MINNPELYGFYKHLVDSSQTEIDKELKEAKNEYKDSLLKFKQVDYFINHFSDKKFEDVLKSETFLSFSFSVTNDIARKKTSDDVNIAYKRYFKAKQELNRVEQVIKEHKMPKVSVNIYNYIITNFNKKMITHLIEDSHCIDMVNVGKVEIIRKYRDRPVPDWEASNKKKAELIEQGRLPLKTIGEDDEGNPVTNGGEAWHIYYEKGWYPYFKWNQKSKKIKNLLGDCEFLPFFKFSPTRGEKGIVSQLHTYNKTRPTHILKYPKA